jgi:glycosyltransferase involved in cell wall biosynthesis
MKISIAIPTWEYNGRGNEFLDDLLRTIEIQSFKDFEVVISDHSLNDNLLNVIGEFKDKFKIVYVKNNNQRGNSPSNTNNAIKNCSGKIIKIMFQDDFFYDDESLEKIYNSFEENVSWLVCGSNHTRDDGNSFYWDLYPSWNDNIIRGLNTISSPSVLAARKEVFDNVKFDTSLVMMMDCEFYYSTKKIYGDPVYYNDILVTNRVHENQISFNYNSFEKCLKMENEIKYCLSKHNC